MKRSFDYFTEEAFIKAIEASIEEVNEIRQGYANWFDTYADLAIPGARTTPLNYFDSILHLQTRAIPKIKKIFARTQVNARVILCQCRYNAFWSKRTPPYNYCLVEIDIQEKIDYYKRIFFKKRREKWIYS